MRVEFEHPELPGRHACEGEPGERLLDAADRATVPLSFSCRAANCAACLVEVLDGSEHLSAPSDDELRVLELFGGRASDRLACQPTLLGPVGLVRLRIVTTRAPR